MYEKKIKINSNDVDSNCELRFSNLFRYMQEVGSEHVDTLHASHADLKGLNLAWVVFRMEVRLYKTPKLDDEIIISTHPGKKKAYIYPRYYEFYDLNRNLIGVVSSMWAIIDRSTRKVVVNPKDVGEIPEEFDENDIPLPLKVEGDATRFVEERNVRYSEIDLNSHLNNTRYIEYILDTHPNSFYKTHRVSKIIINYDREIVEGNKIGLFTSGEEPEIIVGKDDETRYFIAQIEYERR